MEASIAKLIDVPPRDQMGPAMLRLNSRQQRFVCALGVTGGNQAEAYRWAGYEAETENAARANSSRLANAENVVEAIREEAFRRVNSATLLCVSTLVELAGPRNADQKLRLAAANSILDRTGFGGRTEHSIVIKDERTTQELVDFITQRAGAHGLDAKKLLGLPASGAEVVDAEFIEIPNGMDGIEDLF